MKWRALRPVGERLVEPASGASGVDVWPAGYRAFLVQSGTAALALALLVLRDRAAANRRRVLLPAYGCPDLVAAVIHAGLEPELVDTAADEPFMDLDVLDRRLDDDVLAVIGVHLLGLADRIAAISTLAKNHGAVVIEDSAQRIPGAGGTHAVADLVVLSFGRGKPAGALGGGALLVRYGSYTEQEISAHVAPMVRPRVPPAITRLVYNRLIRPDAFGLLARVPRLGVGETRYRPLHGISALDEQRGGYAAFQFAVVAAQDPTPADVALRAMLDRYEELRDLRNCGTGAVDAPLLRYPLLCPTKKVRDAIHAELWRHGLGSSMMYGQTLADLPGVPHCRTESVAVARNFAGRMLTLPVHTDMLGEDLQQIEGVLTRCFLDNSDRRFC